MNDDTNHFTDQQLVSSVLGGNRQDFAVIVRRTERLVAQIVRKMVVNDADQKDLVQEIYLRVYLHLGSFQFKAKLSTWVGNIAYNATINYLNKKRIPISDTVSSLEKHSSPNDEIELKIFQEEQLELLLNEIKTLSPLLQTLLHLYHFEELPIKEISAITNLPEGTIKSHLARARKTLKNKLIQHYKHVTL